MEGGSLFIQLHRPDPSLSSLADIPWNGNKRERNLEYVLLVRTAQHQTLSLFSIVNSNSSVQLQEERIFLHVSIIILSPESIFIKLNQVTVFSK